MPAINSRCRQPHKPGFLFLDSFRPVFRQALKSCTFLFFMLSGLLKPHNHPSLIPLISESQPFPAYSLLSFRDCSCYVSGQEYFCGFRSYQMLPAFQPVSIPFGIFRSPCLTLPFLCGSVIFARFSIKSVFAKSVGI